MDRKLSDIPGYSHPEHAKPVRGNQYKTFTEGERPKKREKFGTTDSGNKYASIAIEHDETNLTQQELEKQRDEFTVDHLSK